MCTMRVFAVMLLLSVGCEEATPLRKVSASGFFNPPEVNFGIRNTGLTYELTTELRNTSAQSIQIQRVRFSPSTDVYLPRRTDEITLVGSTLPPGAGIELVVEYLPRGEGSDDATMTIVFEDFEVDVPIMANARRVQPARPQLRPDSLTLRDVSVDGFSSQIVEVVNAGETDGALESIQARPPFSVRAPDGGPLPLPSTSLAPGESLEVMVTYAPTQAGRDEDSVVFEFDTEARAVLSVVGEAMPAGRLICTPSEFDLGDVPFGQDVLQQVQCQVSEGPYELARLRFAPGSSTSFRLVEVPPGVDGDGGVTVLIRFLSDTLPSDQAATLEFEATHGAVTSVDFTARSVLPDPSASALFIEFRWNTSSDFDLHLVRAPGSPFSITDDCYFERKIQEWGLPNDSLDNPVLYPDKTKGFGRPETIRLQVPREERYDVYVQYFAYEGQAVPATDARVEITLNGRPPLRIDRRMVDCGAMWHVGRIEFTDGEGEFFAENTVTDVYRPFAPCE